MSSRSNGVMKVLLTFLMRLWVVTSAACSAARIRLATSSLSEVLGEHLGQELRTDHEVLGRPR